MFSRIILQLREHFNIEKTILRTIGNVESCLVTCGFLFNCLSGEFD